MKATELRIGNWVDYFGKAIEVEAHHFNTREMDEGFKPIPLTEEWFKKFGCKPEFYGGQGNIGYNVLVKGLGRLFSHDGLIWHPSMALANFLKCELKYVHQFQNLYHTLKGEELELAMETQSS